MNPTDPVNPNHYGGDAVMRAIEACGVNFGRGSVAKYVLRAGKKEKNSELIDLKKARWYLDREIARLEA